eukprot:844425_1
MGENISFRERTSVRRRKSQLSSASRSDSVLSNSSLSRTPFLAEMPASMSGDYDKYGSVDDSEIGCAEIAGSMSEQMHKPLLRKTSRPTASEDHDWFQRSAGRIFLSRASMLVTLLLAQSLSSLVLSSYENMLKQVTEVAVYLTMLIGAGGNTGNQICIDVVRAIATRRIKMQLWPDSGDEELSPRERGYDTVLSLIARELSIGVVTSLTLCVFAYSRVYLIEGFHVANAITITLLIVLQISVVIGVTLPLIMFSIGIDPLHAGPTSQVLLDVIGVTITCAICTALLYDPNKK